MPRCPALAGSWLPRLPPFESLGRQQFLYIFAVKGEIVCLDEQVLDSSC